METQFDSEDWQQYNKALAEQVQRRVDKDVIEAKELCKKQGITFEEFATNSFRLTKNSNGYRVDWYPKTYKCFIHKSQKWRPRVTLQDVLGIIQYETL